MQELARAAQMLLAPAVDRVAHQGMLDVGEVDANLVRAAGPGLRFCECVVVVVAQHAVVSDRLPSAAGQRQRGHPLPLPGVSPDGGFDTPLQGFQMALQQRQIALGDRPRLELRLQVLANRFVLGCDDQAGGVLVQTMHDARPLLVASIRQIGAVRQQSVDQRAAPVAVRWMHDHPRRFVDHQQVTVFIHHIKGDGFREQLVRLGLRYPHDYVLPHPDLVAGSKDSAVHGDAAFLDPALNLGAGAVGQFGGQVPIQTRPRLFHGQRDDLFSFGEQVEVSVVKHGDQTTKPRRLHLGCSKSCSRFEGCRFQVPEDASNQVDKVHLAIPCLLVCLFAHFLFRQHQKGQQCYADDDGAVGHIEGGPVGEVEKIHHVAETQPVRKIAQSATQLQSQT